MYTVYSIQLGASDFLSFNQPLQLYSWILYTGDRDTKEQPWPSKSIQPDRRRLADEVYDELVEAIIRRDIGLEDTLVQEKLASEMQISRTPVREALMRLAQEGVLEVSKPGQLQAL